MMATGDGVTGPINIGDPTEFSMLDLARLVVDLVGARSKIVHKPRPTDDPRQRRPDISQAQEQLSWTPRMPLKEGLTRTVAYFDKLLSESSVREALIDEPSA